MTIREHFQPDQPVDAFLFDCSSKFQLEQIQNLAFKQISFGFIIMNLWGSLCSIMKNGAQEILENIPDKLKTRRDGQAYNPFLVKKQRKAFLNKIKEIAIKTFFVNSQWIVDRIIIGVTETLKKEMNQITEMD